MTNARLQVYLAFANTHEPLEAPQRFVDLYPQSMQSQSRMMLGAMVTAMDEAIGSECDSRWWLCCG